MGRGTVRNELFTPELWEKVNPENKQLLEDFLAYKQSSSKSPQTLVQYRQVIRFFMCWNHLYNNDKHFTEIKKREFVRFFSDASTIYGWSPNRIINVKSSLSSLSNYIENILDDEYEDFRNLVIKIEVAEKSPVREKTVLSEEQLDQCLNNLVKTGKYQVACYLALDIYSGARKSELLRFKVDYFKPENIEYGCLYKTPEPIRTKGRGKNGKMICKYVFAKMFQPYFDMWMQERKRLGIESEWLFVVKKGNHYEQAKVSTANSWCDTISQYLGAPFYSHAGRHRLVTMCKENNLPNSIIVELVGWEKGNGDAMVSVYSDIDESKMLADYFDENGIRTDIKSGTIDDVANKTARLNTRNKRRK